MGIYDEYLTMQLDLNELNRLRWEQLQRISDLRGRAVFVAAADLQSASASIDYRDILPFSDRISQLEGEKIDLILETPGGQGTVAEDLVRLVRDRFTEFGVIVPGWAKSAGTIMAMAADEILMGPTSALGPIDAQLSWQGKAFSADALIKGFESIKDDIDKSGTLSKAYIPILQNISPGELMEAQNALDFAKELVTEWLAKYKFRNWTVRESRNVPVTDDDRRERANEIAHELCNHGRWFTHGKSLRISDLRDLKLRITDYSENEELADAIARYYTLLQILFESTTIYKVWEIPGSWVVRHTAPASVAPPARLPQNAESVDITIPCPKCQQKIVIQADLDEPRPLKAGRIGYPEGDTLVCPSCSHNIDLKEPRNQIELQTKRTVVPYKEAMEE